MAKHKIIQHPTFHIGMSADHALIVARKSGRGKPDTNAIGKNNFAIIVKWYFSDVTLVLAKPNKVKPFEVIRIEEKQDPEAYRTLSDATPAVTVPPGTEEYQRIVESLKASKPHVEET